MTYTRNEKLIFYNDRKIHPTNIWLTFIFLGWSYGKLGEIGKQILFYLTFGGFGIWSIYVLFTLNGKINDFNRKLAIELGLEDEDLNMLGLRKRLESNLGWYIVLAILGVIMLIQFWLAFRF
jgi:hypothetical protein